MCGAVGNPLCAVHITLSVTLFFIWEHVMLDQRDWLDLVRVLERAQAVWDVGDRRTAHFH